MDLELRVFHGPRAGVVTWAWSRELGGHSGRKRGDLALLHHFLKSSFALHLCAKCKAVRAELREINTLALSSPHLPAAPQMAAGLLTGPCLLYKRCVHSIV